MLFWCVAICHIDQLNISQKIALANRRSGLQFALIRASFESTSVLSEDLPPVIKFFDLYDSRKYSCNCGYNCSYPSQINTNGYNHQHRLPLFRVRTIRQILPPYPYYTMRYPESQVRRRNCVMTHCFLLLFNKRHWFGSTLA